jgi:peptide alpha-N-acetyltransferase
MAEPTGTPQMPAPDGAEPKVETGGIKYIQYSHEGQLPWITRMMEKDLSEPYSVFTYRYFVNQWPSLCWLVRLRICFCSALGNTVIACKII